LNALTIVTEFIAVAPALDYPGVPKELGVALSAVTIMTTASTGGLPIRTLRAGHRWRAGFVAHH
jgi:hypothetical protein